MRKLLFLITDYELWYVKESLHSICANKNHVYVEHEELSNVQC